MLRILELYREMPYLWNKTHKDYKNKNTRNDGQRVLLEIYKELEPNATLKTLNKKIQNLRTNYAKEYKKVKDSIRTGAGADEIYVPNLYYYNALSFLGACSESCRNTRDTLESENNTSDDEIQHETQRKKKKLTQASILEKQDKIMTTADKLLNFKDKEEDWVVLGKSIGLQLRDLDKKSLRITQKIISDAIYYASIGALTHNSYICLDSPSTRDLPYVSPTNSSSDRHQEFHQYNRSFHQSSHPSPPPEYSIHSSPSPQPISHRTSSSYKKMQSSQQPPSSYNQENTPEAPPFPYNQLKSAQLHPSPYQMQNINQSAPLSDNHMTQSASLDDQTQLLQQTSSSHDQIQSTETLQDLGANFEFCSENFPNTSLSTSKKSEGKRIVIKEFLILNPKKKKL